MSSSDSPDRPEGAAAEALNQAQRVPRERGPVDYAAYLRFLSELPDADPADLRRRGVLRGEAFRL